MLATLVLILAPVLVFVLAIRKAIAKANETVRNIHWFQVTETRGFVAEGKVAHWQVTQKIGFTLE